MTPYGRKITDVHHYGQLATWDVLVKSSNIGMSMLGERMGNAKLHRALTSFGFGQPTGIELPGEDPGCVNPLKKWNKFSTESVAQGYELMVTPLQLARAFCAYANGGRLVEPRLVKGVLDAEGQHRQPHRAEAAASCCPQAIDPMTAAEMKRDPVRHGRPRHRDQGAAARRGTSSARPAPPTSPRHGRLQRRRVQPAASSAAPGREPAARHRVDHPRARQDHRPLRRHRQRPAAGRVPRAQPRVPAGPREPRPAAPAAADRQACSYNYNAKLYHESHGVRRRMTAAVTELRPQQRAPSPLRRASRARAACSTARS